MIMQSSCNYGFIPRIQRKTHQHGCCLIPIFDIQLHPPESGEAAASKMIDEKQNPFPSEPLHLRRCDYSTPIPEWHCGLGFIACW
ncbi:hypothetical protein BDZ97DRAFT_785167 [Flammula alnicola]|nr:hypothetical protein BDZ97DRAFT_785167 [Flammula alnicola]